MVGIISLNACVDKTFFVPALQADTVMLSREVFVQAGGKGFNVARVLKSLGAEPMIFTMLAGEQGRYIRTLLDKEGLKSRCVYVAGQSRMYITVLSEDHRQFAVKENGPAVSPEEAQAVKSAFLDFLDREKPEFLCISDTVVPKTLLSFYPFAIREAHRRGIPVFFDCDGETLRLGLEAGPDYIKPNTEEFSELYGKIGIAEGLRFLQAHGISHPLISRGEDGVSFLTDGREYHAFSENTACVSPIGCGDSFIGGTVYGITRGFPFAECVRWGSAAAACNAEKETAACVTRAEVMAKLASVQIHAVLSFL